MGEKSINSQREEMLKTSPPQTVIAALKKVKCKECNGYGCFDDSDCYDMMTSYVDCEDCNGTGWNGKDLKL